MILTLISTSKSRSPDPSYVLSLNPSCYVSGISMTMGWELSMLLSVSLLLVYVYLSLATNAFLKEGEVLTFLR